ncbi:MAG: glucose-6-phosphate isomerase, partial [Pseudomonadales bacterium]|nr:glucose-6-phosphate isomerase [Pseudomonadales bacterium]
VNVTENRPALHTALRTPAGKGLPGIETEVQRTRARVADFVSRIRDGSLRGCTGKPFRHVVYIGIGGSHLGPELAVRALGTDRRLDIRFVSNIDGYALSQALDGCDPERTLFVTASKSFSTLETLENSRTARSWFLERTGLADGVANHFAAISANVEAAAAFGIHPDNVFPMWDWVGGRYSLWSAVGMPVALALGNSAFDALLAGARAMDEHFADAPLEHNMPVLAALFGVWNTNFLGAENHAVLAYDERLTLLPLYLQQLETESNGKRTRVDGTAVDTHTMPILWGGVGTSGQHAYHQLLHQGTRAFSADFIFTAESATPLLHHHRWLQANALAQSQAMFLGDATTQPEKQVPGNHATTTLVLDRLDAYHLGALLALHEHQVFCQGVIWGINSFDQWGVELGKRLANPIHEALEGGESRMQDASTRFLINHLRAFDQSSASSGSQP